MNTKQTNKGDLYNLIGGVVEGYMEELSADNYMMIDHLTEVINDEVQKKVEMEKDSFEKGLIMFVAKNSAFNVEKLFIEVLREYRTYLSNLKEINELH